MSLVSKTIGLLGGLYNLYALGGTNGGIVVRQKGGTAGTNEVQITALGGNPIVGMVSAPASVNRDWVASCNGSSLTGIQFQYQGYATFIVSGTPEISQTGSGLGLTSDNQLFWTNSTSNAIATADTGFARAAAGVVSLTNGSTGAGGYSSVANSPAQITSDQNNYSPGVGLNQRWNSDAARNITGMAAGVAGETRFIWNVGSQNIVLQNENASSTAANRFTCTTGADITLAANKCALAMYDATSARWRVTLLP